MEHPNGPDEVNRAVFCFAFQGGPFCWWPVLDVFVVLSYRES